MALAAAPLGLALGVAVGMLGGGSVLAVPALVYVFGESVHEATTASLVVVTAHLVAGRGFDVAVTAAAVAGGTCSSRPPCSAARPPHAARVGDDPGDASRTPRRLPSRMRGAFMLSRGTRSWA